MASNGIGARASCVWPLPYICLGLDEAAGILSLLRSSDPFTRRLFGRAVSGANGLSNS